MTQKSSVFIKIDNYREVLDLADELRQQLVSVQQSYDELQTIRAKEDEELALWKQNLDAIDRQLEQVDNTLFEPEQ